MSLPNPVEQKSHDVINNKLSRVMKEVAEESMKRAAVKENSSSPDNLLTVSGDGTWKTRGHSSLIGVCTVIGAETGKVLDREVLSSFCKGYDSYKGVKFGIKYNKWQRAHKISCRKNYSGSAGKMEVDGMLRIFNRSEKLHNLKYSNYIGDGDTKTFNALSENKPYGDDHLIQKIECVGHVQKRMGTRLMKLKLVYSKKELSDGKTIGGKGRLTNTLIDKLAHYYGNAIRCNSTSVKEMRKAIWAVWGHSCSTDDEPMHWFCPTNPNTWYLSHPALLKKCLGGKTQNPNESLNSLISKFCPKTIGSSLQIAEIAASLATSVFNDGNQILISILEKFGLKINRNVCVSLAERDNRRIFTSRQRRLEPSFEARRAKKIKKSKKIELFKEQEDFAVKKDDEKESNDEKYKSEYDSSTEIDPDLEEGNKVKNQGSSPSLVSARSAEMKLPTLSLPIFSGVTEEWLAFSDLFEAAVSNNQNLTGVQKLQYLKDSLKEKQGAVNVLNSSELSVNASVFSLAPIPGTCEPSKNSRVVDVTSCISDMNQDVQILLCTALIQNCPIDVLLGVDLILPLLKDQTLSLGKDKPFAIRSELGWIIGEEACEDHFVKTHSRYENGRYTVRLPFHTPPTRLGNSKQNEIRRIISVECHLIPNPDKYKLYQNFMKEYLDLNKTSSGLYLNDLLMVGPRVQPELFPILIQFRIFRVAICADIEKMFRQIKVHEKDVSWQRIIWRYSPTEPIRKYRLITATYGTSSAPFLSTRILRQLAIDQQENYPAASRATLCDESVWNL
ncbi:uncharacterized protein TNCV_5023181 [Trichonephila clavipes]|nr:uncharacterized protein TNCV_5023181 [Trichonephila clavipes]